MPFASPSSTRVLAVWTAVLAGCTDVVVERDISYDTRFASTAFDAYMPPPAATPRPAVLVVHGGGWRVGLERDGMADHAQRLADAGYVAFNLSYRLVGASGDESGVFPRAIQDVYCALAFIRAHASDYDIDPDRIGAIGYSAGGHLVSMLGVATDVAELAPDCEAGAAEPPQAVVSGAGPQEMGALLEADAVVNFMGGTEEQVPERYAMASPLTHVREGAPPFLFIHGEDDWFVSLDHSTRMRDALLDAGNDARILAIPGGGHLWNRGASSGLWDFEISIDTPQSWAATIDFLDRAIGPVP